MAKASDIKRSSASTRHDDPNVLIVQVRKDLKDELTVKGQLESIES